MSETGQLTNSESKPLSVAALNSRAKAKLKDWPAIWVEGELLKLREYGSTTYGTLRDLDGSASVDFVIWGNNYPAVDERFKESDRVIINGRFDIKPADGRLQFHVLQIRKVGLGDLLEQLELLRQKLRAEGLIDESKRKPIPFLPNRIGLITGKDSDAQKDVVQNVLLRWPDAQFRIENVIVQGETSPMQVVSAIKKLDDDPEVDVIIIARGGGAFLELIGFSDERVLRAAAAAKTPIISAIGHEADRPLLDDVADLRASTPTDAAKRVVPDVAEENARLLDALSRMTNKVASFVAHQFDFLAQLTSRPVLASPFGFIDEKTRDLELVRNDCLITFENLDNRELATQETQAGVLRSLSPQGTLDRGYAVVRNESGRVLTDPESVKAGTKLKVRLSKGELDATSN